MKNPFTKEALKRILPFVKGIKKLEVLKKGKAAGAVMLAVYTVVGGATCFTFLPKAKFFEANREQRRAAANDVEVIEKHANEFIVKGSTGNHYVVRPKELDPSWRCECPDAFYRGAKCKHQIAVAEFKRHQSANEESSKRLGDKVRNNRIYPQRKFS